MIWVIDISSMRILLVNDDDLSREMMAEILKDLSDHEIIECRDAVEASEIYLADPCSIVITDINILGYSGLDLLREIKNSHHGKDTDVIVMTGVASIDSAIEALRAGATDLLRKPINVSLLLENINKNIKKQKFPI